MKRRSFLTGLAGILAAGMAPAVLPSGVIMPIRKLWVPSYQVAFTVGFAKGMRDVECQTPGLQTLVLSRWSDGSVKQVKAFGNTEIPSGLGRTIIFSGRHGGSVGVNLRVR